MMMMMMIATLVPSWTTDTIMGVSLQLFSFP